MPTKERQQAAGLPQQICTELGKTVKTQTTINFVDLFAGAGGLSQGFRHSSCEQVEYRSVFAVEKDPPSAATYGANFGHSVFTKPIEELKRSDFPEVKVDLVIGGPPCQGFSPLGKMSPSDHHPSMNQLWKFYLNVVKWTRPKAFVIENVPEFLKSYEFSQVKNAASRLGYRVECGVLPAIDFGVPQQRRRGFAIGLAEETPTLPPPRLFVAAKTVKHAIWDLRRKPLVFELSETDRFLGFPKYTASQLHIGRNPTAVSLARYRCVPAGGNRFDLMRKRPDLTPGCWKRKKSGSTDVFGRLRWDEPALTIRTEFFKPEKGCYLHPEFDRPITHWEAARLQTFPDNYIFCGSKIEIARQIGNAVPPLLAEAVATHLKGYFVKRIPDFLTQQACSATA
jgi:DNA (cytosine-5)-methyltransferase 1